ncbi:MAG TPA: hypothetical protein VN611_00580 [Patescibacteria group bacterium]|nr:hypothetical protein [Patescibacteria group bacterium]
MNSAIKNFFCGSILTMLLLLTPAAPSFASEPSAPTNNRPYIAWDMTGRHSAIVYLLNLTPYNMSLKSSPFTDHVMDSDPSSPFMFSPTGIPNKVPAETGAAFMAVWQQDTNGNVAGEYDLSYTIQGVDSTSHFGTGRDGCTVNPLVGDVTLHLEFDRVKESKTLKSDIFQDVIKSVKVIVQGGKVIASGGTAGMLKFLNCVYKLGQSIDNTINDANSNSDQGYFNAYILSYNGDMNKTPTIVSYESNPDKASENAAIATQQADGNGCPQAVLVVPVSILRERSADEESLSGNLPVILAAVVTIQDWASANVCSAEVKASISPAGNKIENLLRREGPRGQKTVFKLVNSLNASEFQNLTGAYEAISKNKHLSLHQEALLARLAIALEKNETSLKPGEAQKTSGRVIKR